MANLAPAPYLNFNFNLNKKNPATRYSRPATASGDFPPSQLRTNSPTPTLMHASAMLNAGQLQPRTWKSKKSNT